MSNQQKPNIPNPFQPSYQPKPNQPLPLHLKWAQKRVLRDENTPYNDPGIDCTGDPGVTDQSHSNDADINVVLKRYMQTGVLPGAQGTPIFDDFSTSGDYMDAMNVIVNAQHQFDSLDAFVRKKFDNDPAKFLEYASDPKNGQGMVDMGIATYRPEPDADRLERAINTSNETRKTKASSKNAESSD